MTISSLQLDTAKPIMMVAHPRSRSSAIERVFIQNQGHVKTLHEPFGDAYWLGTERQLGRYEGLRHASGFANSTYKGTANRIAQAARDCRAQGKRLFIKEMAFFLFPGPGHTSRFAQSFGDVPAEPRNPTLLPRAELAKFQYAFLVRHPYLSVPSYYRICQPDKKKASCVEKVNRSDLGYAELRRLFDYLREEGIVGSIPGHDLFIIDSEELMEHPDEVMFAFCRSNGIEFDSSALSWDRDKDQRRAAHVIDRWGFSVTFHEAVLSSTGLIAKKKAQLDAEFVYQRWIDEFGRETADEIRAAANSQMCDYNYLRRFVAPT